jgi:hypothetical protein
MLAAATLAAIGFGSAITCAAESTVQELKEQIDALQHKVNSLEVKQNSGDAAATADAIFRDTQRRSQFLSEEGSPFLAGYKKDKGFRLQDEKGDFVLHLWFQFQPRYVTNWREGAKNSNDDIQSGFEIRRMKFGVDGNVFGPDLSYLFNWATNRKTGALELEEAWAKYKFNGEWFVRGGQLKDPLAHEQIMSSKTLLAADRSLLNEIFIGGDDFVQAVTLGYGGDKSPIQAEIAFTDGSQTANTNFQDDISNTTTAQARPDYGFAGRVQYKVFGDWKNYQDFTARGTKTDLFVIGAGADYTEISSTRNILHTVDAQYETTFGLSLYGAFIGRYTDPGAGDTRYDWGALGQVAYMLDPNHWEVFGRYDYIRPDTGTFSAGSERNIHEFTAGVNYYFQGHAAKMTLDASWLPNGCPVAQDGIGVLANDGDNELIVRLQFQLLL